MINVAIETNGQATEVVVVSEFPCVVGRQSECGITLPSWRVARRHAQLLFDGRFLSIVDQGSLGGTWVNGERIVEFGPLCDSDEVIIAGFSLRVFDDQGDVGDVVNTPPATPVSIEEQDHDPALSGGSPARAGTLDARRRLQRDLLGKMDLRRQEIRHLDASQLRSQVCAHLRSIVQADAATYGHLDADYLIAQVADEAIGLGVLEPLLAAPDISEIMVNGTDLVFIERNGKLEQTDLRFTSDEAVRSVIDRIVAPLGRRIDDASPMVDARLPDGSRVNAVIAPLSIKGPAMTIRRFNTQFYNSDDFVLSACASKLMMDFLSWAVRLRLNIIVSGGTGSGKTTLLNLLSGHIDAAERVVTIEDAAELRLTHNNIVSLESRPGNNEGRGEISIRDLVRNALRMRPDRIIVGECRGGEALDMLQAMNTGHDGSLTTVHANSARDVLSRLEVMVLMSGVEIPVQAIREQICAATDVIVQLARGRDGVRRIVEVIEIGAMEGAKIQSQALFEYHDHSGRFERSGNMPDFIDRQALPSQHPVRRLFSRLGHV